jgi:hypothetical protein
MFAYLKEDIILNNSLYMFYRYSLSLTYLLTHLTTYSLTQHLRLLRLCQEISEAITVE